MFDEFKERTKVKYDVLTEVREFIDNEFLAGRTKVEIDDNVKIFVRKIENQYDRLSASAVLSDYIRNKFKGE